MLRTLVAVRLVADGLRLKCVRVPGVDTDRGRKNLSQRVDKAVTALITDGWEAVMLFAGRVSPDDAAAWVREGRSFADYPGFVRVFVREDVLGVDLDRRW